MYETAIGPNSVRPTFSTGGAASGTSLRSPAPSVTSDLIEQLSSFHKQLDEITNIARGTADAVFGCQPETNAPSGAQSQPSARADAARIMAAAVQDQILKLRTQVERLTCI